jgi:hypothetical protein
MKFLKKEYNLVVFQRKRRVGGEKYESIKPIKDNKKEI